MLRLTIAVALSLPLPLIVGVFCAPGISVVASAGQVDAEAAAEEQVMPMLPESEIAVSAAAWSAVQ